MSGIVSRGGRRGHTAVPNWRWEDLSIDPYTLRVAGWIASHADRWREDYVSRNLIAKKTGIAASKVSECLAQLRDTGVITVRAGERGRFVIEFDIDVWTTPPPESTESTSSPLVATRPVATRPVTGRHTTSDRSPHDHIEEQGEEQGENPPNPPQAGGRKSRRKLPPEPLSIQERANDFNAWWESYPRRIGKMDAITAWRVMLDYIPNLDQMIAASKATEARVRREHTDVSAWERFIPHPATWLRRGDYLDGASSTTPVQVRRPCVLCGINDPSLARCRGVTDELIESAESECIWR